MTLLLIYLFVALCVSFLCSIVEAVLLSITPSYITLMEDEGGKDGMRLRRLKDDVDRPLSALLSLNTIAHTVGAAGVGAQTQAVFGSEYLAAASAIVTFLILVFSEIIPKTLGATYWRGLAPTAAVILQWMVILLYPLVLMSMGITRLLRRNETGPSVSRDEFRAMAEQGEAEGIFHGEESGILRNLLHSGSLRVKDILTPRPVVIAFKESAPVTDVMEQLGERRISRLPVHGDDSEDITGFVLLNDVLIEIARDRHNTSLHDLRREVLVVPETLSLYGLFRSLLERREEMAVVVDEYGGLAGVATMEDVVETLLGMEIMDENDDVDDLRRLARGRWLERARRLGLVDEDSDINHLSKREPAS